MTVTIYSNAAINAAYSSTRYEATVNGTAAPVWRTATASTEFTVPNFWAFNAAAECSFLNFATDETVTVTITPVTGDPAFTSAEVFPKELDIPWTLTAGNVVLTLAPGQSVRVETDNQRGQPIYVRALEPIAEPAGTDYDGSQTAASGVLKFPSGITDLTTTGAWNDKLFPVQTGATVYIPGDAWVIGSFDVRNSDDVTIIGHGVLSGEYTTNEIVGALPTFAEQHVYSAIYGYVSGFDFSGNTVEGITVVNSPFYSLADCANIVDAVMVLVPFHNNTDGIKAFGDAADNNTFYIRNSVVWVGDDAIDLGSFRRNGVVTNNLVSTSGSACFLHSYYAEYQDYGFTMTVTDNYVRAVCDYYLELDGDEGGAVIQCWTDGYEVDGPAIGTYNVTYNGLYVESDDTAGVSCVLMSIGNTEYPWGTPRDSVGQVGNWSLNNVYVEYEPAEVSKIRSLDEDSTPYDIEFNNLWIGGEQVGAHNHALYFDIDEFAYDIAFGGRFVTTAVDVCNLALGLIGNKAKVTAISPSDGSMEADHCARLYPIAVRSVLEMHNWSFAKRKDELTVVNADPDDTDDPAWLYRYQLPSDWVKIISILPLDTTNDYLVAGTKQPVDYEIKYSGTDTQQRIYTNEEDAWVRYIYYEDDPNQWSHLFIQAVMWHLAALLAGPIIKGAEGHTEAQRCLQRMSAYLAEARMKDANERQATVERKASWLRGR